MDTRDQKLAIIEIQQNLRELHNAGWAINSIVADGIYGERTREAVRQFQTIEGLPATGIMDSLTWRVLQTAADIARSQRAPSHPIYPFNRPLKDGTSSPGEQTDLIYIAQLMLRESVAYDYELPLTGVLDQATQTALRDFQQINGLPQTGVLDLVTWNALADAYNKYLPQTGDQ